MASILTIAIPTYNRYEQVQRQVRILLPQLNERVELVIYDNCCTSPIASLFGTEELAWLRIVRNSTNVGADANIARCFENCKTKWLWTLSDDDWVKADAVNNILKYIDSHEQLLFTCFLGKNKMETTNFHEFCTTLSSLATFSGAFTMSLCLYNMSLLKPSLRYYYENITTMLGTLVLVLKYAEEKQNVRCCFSDIQLIEEFDPNVGWNYVKFLRQSRLLLYSLDAKNRKFYNKSVFKGYHLTNYFLISLDRKSSNVSRLKRIKYLLQVVKSQGVFNAMRYNLRIVMGLLVKLIFK